MKVKKIIMSLLILTMATAMSSMQLLPVMAASKATTLPGTVWFAPMPEKNTQPFVSKIVTLNGSEVFTSWGEIEKEEGVYDWSEIDAIKENYKTLGKKISIRITAANFSINDTPSYVFNKYGVRRIAKGYWLNFENGTKDYNVKSGTVVQESASNHVLLLKNTLGEKLFLSTTQKHDFLLQDGYAVQFAYKGITDTNLFVRVSYLLGGIRINEDTDFAVKTNESDMKSVEFQLKAGATEYQVEWGIKGSGEVQVDNINIIEKKSGYHVGRLTYPNYFDPEFKVQYEKFVKAFAAKYGNDADVDSVSVGGYGRWEEMTLCDDLDLNALEDQWTTFGFTNENYINHIKWCIDQYTKYFPGKNVIMCAVGFPGADKWRDQNLIEWKAENYAVKKGVGLKYNGWQSMHTEWGSSASAIFYMMDRYKNTDIPMYYEEGGQVNNEGSPVMGHPISVLNQSVLNKIDYQWIYSVDFLDPYFSKYLQYSNQGAGSTLVTKLYNQIGAFPFYSNHTKKNYVHYDLFMGLFQTKGNDRIKPKGLYGILDGVRYVSTTASQNTISFSLDDRQKYSGMYGSYVVIDYFDKGTDQFTVNVQSPKGITELGKVVKTDSSTWKSVAYYEDSWTNHYRNGDKDNLSELEIYDGDDGVEFIKAIELNYVPSREYQETQVESNEPSADTDNGTELGRTAITLEIPNTNTLSGISIPVSPIEQVGYVNLTAKVYATQAGNEELITTKDYYMPENGDWFYLPVAPASRAEKYRIEVICDKGTARWNTSQDGKLGYRLFEYAKGEDEARITENDDKTIEMESLLPFAIIKVEDKKAEGASVRIEKKMSDGTFVEVVNSAIVKNGTLSIKPQTPGGYRLQFASNPTDKIKTVYLKRISQTNPSTRYLVGEIVPEFLAMDKKTLWTISSGFKEIDKGENNSFTALLKNENASIEMGEKMAVAADKNHVFHFIIKNETSSGLAKLFWETDNSGYNEENSMLIPIVANDDKYREYSMPVGSELTYKGNITGLKVIPAYGHTDVGRISLFTMDLRNGTKKYSTYNEALDISKISSEGAIYVGAGTGKESPVLIWAIFILGGAVIVAAAFIGFALKTPRKKSDGIEFKNETVADHEEQI